MGNSLQDQLLKAGLTDEKKVNRARKAKQQKEKAQRHAKVKTEDESKVRARQAQQQQAERDRELNRLKQEEANNKAIAAQIKQLIELNALDLKGAELAYNFTDNKKVARVYVTDAVQGQLSRGLLAIVKLDDRYKVAPAGVAEKISLRDESMVLVRNESSVEELGEDDPYAEFKIPDDLMW